MNLADMPDDLEFNANAPLTTPNPAQRFVKVYSSPCKRCAGSGRFHSAYGRPLGQCFVCKGVGQEYFKTPVEVREKARDQAAARKERSEQGNLDAFQATNAAEFEWMLASAATFEFAASMLDAVRKYGSLTDRQLAAVRKCVESRRVRTVERDQRVASAPVVDTTALQAAFDTAATRGLRSPKITLATMQIKPARQHPGVLYVTEQGQYLGKVMGGRFLRVSECTEENAQRVASLINDPKGAAEAYGKETGVCCICSKTLTNPESIERGIGPICAGNMGW